MRTDHGEEESFAAAAARVGRYHEQQLLLLADRVREALHRLDAGDIDVFEFDALVHQYKRAANELWKTCSVGGQQLRRVAILLAEDDGEPTDWWELAAPKRRR
jgi:hypothetical protein